MNKLIQLYENAHEHTRKKTKGVTSISFGGADNEYLSSSGVDGLIKVIYFIKKNFFSLFLFLYLYFFYFNSNITLFHYIIIFIINLYI